MKIFLSGIYPSHMEQFIRDNSIFVFNDKQKENRTKTCIQLEIVNEVIFVTFSSSSNINLFGYQIATTEVARVIIVVFVDDDDVMRR